LTDDESDDGHGFEVPVPELADLIKGFEQGDDKIQKRGVKLQDVPGRFEDAWLRKGRP